jgi:hypothetical protein
MQRNRTNLFLGILLMLVGVWLVVSRQVPAVQDWLDNNFTWHMGIIGFGLLVLLIGLVTGAPGMAVPASILAGVGGILYYQSTTGDYTSWSYMWTLFPGFVGVGTILTGLLGENTRYNLMHGVNLIVTSAVMFVVFSTLFGGPSLFGGEYGAPAVLILAGFYILIRGFVRGGYGGQDETR